MPDPVDSSVAVKSLEIASQPYAKYITSEDVLERNFGYRIIRHQISSGKNSVIYKCEAKKYQELYCIVKAYKLGKDKVKLSLKEEVCQIMRFVSGKCPQIISTYDMFYTDEKIYLMSDWSSMGEVLTNMRRKSFRLSESLLRIWATDMLNGVNFLHSNAICHRNLAPNCLLLTSDNHVKIATLSDAAIYCNGNGDLIKQKWPKFSRFSNWNQPPEVAKSKPYDPRRSDVWSIGATIYWFITKTHPIDYRSSTKLTKQLSNRLVYLRKVSPECQSFVTKMLTYQPPSRPTIAAALQMEWIGSQSSATDTQVTRDSGPDIEISNATQQTGEASGPEDSMTPGASDRSNSEKAKLEGGAKESDGTS